MMSKDQNPDLEEHDAVILSQHSDKTKVWVVWADRKNKMKVELDGKLMEIEEAAKTITDLFAQATGEVIDISTIQTWMEAHTQNCNGNCEHKWILNFPDDANVPCPLRIY